MSIDFYTPPTVDEIIARCKTYVKGELKELNPTDQNSLIFSLIVALANLSNDNNKQILLDILPNIFPQYCKSEESLENHAYIRNVPRNSATSSSGKATIQGEVGRVISMGSVFIANNQQFKTSNSVEIATEDIALSSLSVNGTLVTAVTASNHNLASNIKVNITGAEEEKLNGEYTITVTGLNSFTYSIEDELQLTETENISASADIAVLNLKSLNTGADTNLNNGDAVAISDAVEGVNANAYVQYSGISGGADVQSFEDWKENVVDDYRNPITAFNENNIRKAVLGVSGVTRCWVYPITPDVGQVTVFFIRGNDEDIIPDFNEISKVKEVVQNLRTVKDDNDDVFVNAPTKKVVNFNFTSILPDTPTMKTAIQNSLKQFFEDEIELGKNLTALDYNNAIGNSFDMETGTKLKSYSLSNPTSDISVNFGELPVLGEVTFL